MKYTYTIILLTLSTFLSAQDTILTAEEILDASIAFCGEYSPDKSSELTYIAMMPDSNTITIDEKRIEGEKFSQAILSMSHIPKTTFFNGRTLAIVNGGDIDKSNFSEPSDAIKLRTFTNIQIGYKTLEYALKRLKDEKFKYFDCYVLMATSKNGYTTYNYFDKTNFRLLMVEYPNGNKSLMKKFEMIEGTLINTYITNTFAGSTDVQNLKLVKHNSERTFSDLWFECPYIDNVEIPSNIKEGHFSSLNGPETEFKRTANSHNYHNKKGDLILKRLLKWTSNDTFVLVSADDLRNKSTSPESKILVRIISWDSNSYVCQWIAGKYTDTQDYKISK